MKEKEKFDPLRVVEIEMLLATYVGLAGLYSMVINRIFEPLIVVGTAIFYITWHIAHTYRVEVEKRDAE